MEKNAPRATSLSAPYVLEYTYRRSVGPVIGRFLSALREGRIEGVKTPTNEVVAFPPCVQRIRRHTDFLILRQNRPIAFGLNPPGVGIDTANS